MNAETARKTALKNMPESNFYRDTKSVLKRIGEISSAGLFETEIISGDEYSYSIRQELKKMGYHIGVSDNGHSHTSTLTISWHPEE